MVVPTHILVYVSELCVYIDLFVNNCFRVANRLLRTSLMH